MGNGRLKHSMVQGLARAWAAWKGAADEAGKKRALAIQALRHWTMRRASLAWQSWLELVERQRQKRLVSSPILT